MSDRNRARSTRATPYALDELAVKAHRSAAGTLWRWRTELATTGALAAGSYELAHILTATLAGLVIMGALALVVTVAPLRRSVTGRIWCLATRHRLHRLCWEERLHTRSGRLPLVVRVRPTKVGERAHLWCRAGICAEDFEDRTETIRAACYAREARVTRHPGRAHLVTIDIVRRDILHAGNAINPDLTHGDARRRTVTITGVRALARRVTTSASRWSRRSYPIT